MRLHIQKYGFSFVVYFALKRIKLIKTYFANATNVDTIRQANFEYLSDAVIHDNMLQIVMLQANANNNNTHKRQRKNTFFLK